LATALTHNWSFFDVISYSDRRPWKKFSCPFWTRCYKTRGSPASQATQVIRLESTAHPGVERNWVRVAQTGLSLCGARGDLLQCYLIQSRVHQTWL
jgi:hypothetical protein